MRRLVAGSAVAIVVALSASLACADDPHSEPNKMNGVRAIVAHDAQKSSASSSEWRNSEPADLKASGMRMAEGLAFCLGILFIGVHFYKKRLGISSPSRAAKDRRLKILERLSVAPKTSLLLAEVEGKKILLAVGSERVTVIDNGASERSTPFATDLELVGTLNSLCGNEV